MAFFTSFVVIGGLACILHGGHHAVELVRVVFNFEFLPSLGLEKNSYAIEHNGKLLYQGRVLFDSDDPLHLFDQQVVEVKPGHHRFAITLLETGDRIFIEQEFTEKTVFDVVDTEGIKAVKK